MIVVKFYRLIAFTKNKSKKNARNIKSILVFFFISEFTRLFMKNAWFLTLKESDRFNEGENWNTIIF